MKKSIENQIKQELDSLLSEIDIQGEIDRLTKPEKIREKIKAEIDRIIYSKVAEAIEMSIFKAIQKNQPLLDAGTADRVRGLMIEFDKTAKEYLKEKG